jgi:ADP-ribose pyrophosphatase YjhB (NUDIX family)
MKLLLTIRDGDFAPEDPAPSRYKERRASRAVVFDADRKVALLHAAKLNYHKLPGGGIEAGENIEAALRREIREEIGCDVANIRELGCIEEYRNKFEIHQLSYCFLADVRGGKGTPHLEEDEIAEGFETVWLDIRTAISTLENDDIEDYKGKFIRTRDLAFLKAALAA